LFDLDELLLEIYVDDPHLVIRGVREARTRRLAVLLLWWQALGLGMAWSKVDRGSKVQWIGAALSILDDWRFKIALPERMVTELAEECDSLLALTGIPLKRLQKFTGRASWAASLVPVLKPFVGSCWAALAETSRREACRGIEVRGLRPEEALVALRQVRHGLSWLRVFFLR
jgi:hypothetical protein